MPKNRFYNFYESDKDYWINSNNNNYVVKYRGLYFLVKEGYSYDFHQPKILTEKEFNNLEGYVPIKYKKLHIHKKNGRFGRKTLRNFHVPSNEKIRIKIKMTQRVNKIDKII